MTISHLRVVAGRDLKPPTEKRELDEARRRARPLNAEWLRRIELAVMAGELSRIDYLLAKALLNYPSANEGRCYAGQERLGAAVGVSARSARAGLARLRARGFLSCQRGGPGKTASWTFCVNDKPVFGGKAFLPDATTTHIEKQQHFVPDRKTCSALDRKTSSAKPSERSDQPIEHDPPLTPNGQRVGSSADEQGSPTQPCEAGAEEKDPFQRRTEFNPNVSFREIWIALGRQGEEGFARAEWRKVPIDDKNTIADHLRRFRAVRRSIWSGTWLRDRVWVDEIADRERDVALPEIVQAFVDPISRRRGRDLRFTKEQRWAAAWDKVNAGIAAQIIVAAPGSAKWRAERERLRSSGDLQSVQMMDRMGRG